MRRAIVVYLRTGDWDPTFAAWPGNIIARCTTGGAALRAELIRAVLRRAAGRPAPVSVPGTGLRALVRKRLAPMVQGLFPAAERSVVLELLVRGIVF